MKQDLDVGSRLRRRAEVSWCQRQFLALVVRSSEQHAKYDFLLMFYSSQLNDTPRQQQQEERRQEIFISCFRYTTSRLIITLLSGDPSVCPSVCLSHSLGGSTVCPRPTATVGIYHFAARYLGNS